MSRRKFTKAMLFVVAVLLLGAMLVACGQKDDDSSSEPQKPQAQSTYLITIDGGHAVVESGNVTSGSYTAGTKLRLEADIPASKQFVKWVNQQNQDVSNLNPFTYTVRAQAGQVVKAVFEDEAPVVTPDEGDGDDVVETRHTLTVVGGTITGSKLTTRRYQDGSQASVSTQIADDQFFGGWQIGDDIVSSEPTYRFEIYGDTIITALIFDKPRYTLTVTNGYINGDEDLKEAQFVQGSTVKVTADVPHESTFEGWQIGQDIVSTSLSYSFAIDKDISIEAVLKLKPVHTVNVTNGTPLQSSVIDGDSVTVTANDDTDRSVFLHWKKGTQTVSALRQYTFTVTEDVELTAVFLVRYEVKTFVDGTLKNTEFVTIGDSYGVVAPKVDGKTFVGWAHEQDGAIQSTSKTYLLTIAQDTTLYAQYDNVEEGSALLEVVGGKAYLDSAYTSELAEYTLKKGDVVYIKPDRDGSEVVVSYANNPSADQALSADDSFKYSARVSYGKVTINCVYRCTLTTENAVDELGNDFGTIDAQEGKTYTLYAKEIGGKKFSHWLVDGERVEGVAEGDRFKTEVTVDGKVQVSAQYINLYKITVYSATIEGAQNGLFEEGEIITIVATPKDGEVFDCWLVNNVEYAGGTTIEYEVVKNATIVACFVAE